MNNGKFVISLDFELMWGVRDKLSIENYGKNIVGVQEVIPKLLKTFDDFNIQATFSTVGFLFFNNKENLLNNLPSIFPNYKDKNLSPYNGYIDNLKNIEDNYHFASNLINQIQDFPNQEIGTHTFSHYYCLEPGQTIDTFKADIEKAIETANAHKIEIKSLVFPRNQFNNEYLQVCTDLGIICYRGNEESWLYKAKMGNQESLFRRMSRMIDCYINLSGHNCYSDSFLKQNTPINIPSSRFLRSYNKKLKLLENLRLQRIKKGMTHAAKNNLTYHLWWHPHNFGVDIDCNFDFLVKILSHYQELNNKYNFQSITMKNLASNILNGK